MIYLAVSFFLWEAWALSWFVAALWTRRTVARPPFFDRLAYSVPTALGAGLLFFGQVPHGYWRFRDIVREGPFAWTALVASWRLPPEIGWAATALVAVGFAFTWWARLTLGSLWSGTVTRKEDHTVVRSGPYRLVRHPIYTGIILAAFALAFQLGGPGNWLGAALFAFGCWVKARLEERFLSAELGEAYADYRATTPMLIPFWPKPG